MALVLTIETSNTNIQGRMPEETPVRRQRSSTSAAQGRQTVSRPDSRIYTYRMGAARLLSGIKDGVIKRMEMLFC